MFASFYFLYYYFFRCFTLFIINFRFNKHFTLSNLLAAYTEFHDKIFFMDLRILHTLHAHIGAAPKFQKLTNVHLSHSSLMLWPTLGIFDFRSYSISDGVT